MIFSQLKCCRMYHFIIYPTIHAWSLNRSFPEVLPSHLAGLPDTHFHRVKRCLFTMFAFVYMGGCVCVCVFFYTGFCSGCKLQLMHALKSFLK